MQQQVVITGANRGIGLALAQAYSEAGAQVAAVCRQSSAELAALPVRVIENIDVSKTSAITRLVAALGDNTIDLLINNAGVLAADQWGSIDYAKALQQFEVNALGPLRVTEALRGQLAKDAKVALITSRMGSIADNSSGGAYGYRMSKAALNAAAMSLHHDLKPQGVAVGTYHPGYVQTDMVAGRGDISTAVCAHRLLERIGELTLATSGGFWHSNGEVLPW